MRRAATLACAATIAAADFVIHRHKPRWILVGFFDHPAHLATASLVLLNLPPRSRRWSLGFLAGSLLPDLDHVPLALREQLPELGDPRPATHCLLAVAPVAGLAAAARSEPLAGAAAGMAAHFLRDVAVGTGVPLLWPVTTLALHLPYPAYAAACALLGLRAVAGPPTRSGVAGAIAG